MENKLNEALEELKTRNHPNNFSTRFKCQKCDLTLDSREKIKNAYEIESFQRPNMSNSLL